jgi:hypothetical protein
MIGFFQIDIAIQQLFIAAIVTVGSDEANTWVVVPFDENVRRLISWVPR